MHGDFESETWADNRHHVNGQLDSFFRKLAHVFRRLHAIQYEAPWDLRRTKRR